MSLKVGGWTEDKKEKEKEEKASVIVIKIIGFLAIFVYSLLVNEKARQIIVKTSPIDFCHFSL